MSKKRKVQIVAIALLVIAVIFLIPNTDWREATSIWGFLILVFGTLGSIISIFIPTSFTFSFTDSDWKEAGENNEFNLFISAKKHGLGNSPKIQAFYKNENTYEEVGVVSEHDEKGNITIGANGVFSGKIIIT